MAATRERAGPFGAPVPNVSQLVGALAGSVRIDDAGQVLIASAGLSSRVVRVTPLQIGATVPGPAETLRARGAGNG